MSAKIVGAVWELKLPAPKLLVLLALSDHADHNGNNVFPSMGLVAWKTGYSERQVRRIVKQLIADKLLLEKKRPGKTTLFSINLVAGEQKEAYNPGQNVTPQTDVTPDKMSPHPGHLDVLPTPDIQMSDEPSVEPSGKKNVRAPKKDVVPFPPHIVRGMETKRADPIGDMQGYRLIKAFIEAFPENARNPTIQHQATVKAAASELARAGYKPEEVTAVVKGKLAAGKTDYVFIWLGADLQSYRLEKQKAKPAATSPAAPTIVKPKMTKEELAAFRQSDEYKQARGVLA